MLNVECWMLIFFLGLDFDKSVVPPILLDLLYDNSFSIYKIALRTCKYCLKII